MNQLPFSKMGEAIDLIVQGQSLRAVADATDISHQCLFRSLVPRVGHGASVLCDLVFENTAEHLDFGDPFWPHEGYRRQLKTILSTYALASILFLYDRVVRADAGATVAMRLGVSTAPWTAADLASRAIEATRWAPPRWPGENTEKPKGPRVHMLFGQPVTVRHMAELAGCTVTAMERRLMRGDTPEEALKPRTRAAGTSAKAVAHD